MHIVIDISEELYKNVIEHTKMGYVGSDVWIAVANGTPLPKGHGRLIDADAYISEINRVFPCNDQDDTNIRRATEIGISGAPILIEADK